MGVRGERKGAKLETTTHQGLGFRVKGLRFQE